MPRGRVRRVSPASIGSVEPIFEDEPLVERSPDQPPADWQKGALLNVRNYGAEYIVTLYPEEHDERHPERAMHFTNLGRCQDFVSAWYSREHCDPRAR